MLNNLLKKKIYHFSKFSTIDQGAQKYLLSNESCYLELWIQMV